MVSEQILRIHLTVTIQRRCYYRGFEALFQPVERLLIFRNGARDLAHVILGGGGLVNDLNKAKSENLE